MVERGVCLGPRGWHRRVGVTLLRKLPKDILSLNGSAIIDLESSLYNQGPRESICNSQSSSLRCQP